MRHRQGRTRPQRDAHSAGQPVETGWLWGKHAVKAALENPRRRLKKALVNPAVLSEVEAILKRRGLTHQSADNETIARSLPRDAVHQGIALLADPLPDLDIHDALEGTSGHRRLIMLDQVSDPHNLGAILRSAAAFGAAGVIVQDRHSPPRSGALAKAASGAVELVPLVRVVNLSRTLEELGERGFFRLAFADEAAQPLNTVDLKRDIVLALGAEGEGLRRLTREKCDVTVRLPTTDRMPSLNVPNAAAIALYACAQAISV